MEKEASIIYVDVPILEPHMYRNTINGHLLSSQCNRYVSKDNEITEEIGELPQVCGHFNHNEYEKEYNGLKKVVIITKVEFNKKQ